MSAAWKRTIWFGLAAHLLFVPLFVFGLRPNWVSDDGSGLYALLTSPWYATIITVLLGTFTGLLGCNAMMLVHEGLPGHFAQLSL